jgi:putative membrane protein
MVLKYILATLHLLALAVGIAAVYARWQALRRLGHGGAVQQVFEADNWYGVAALLWVGTGLWRAFGGVEKGTEHYLESHWFIGKMGLFLLVLLLELLPMVTLVRWRMARMRHQALNTARAPLLARLSLAQVPLLLLMVFMATALARGL